MKYTNLPMAALACSIIIFSACRKNDISPQVYNETEKKFFTASANTAPEVKPIIEAISRQNNNEHFLNDLVKRVGYPKWDKAMIAGPGAGKITGRTSSDSDGYTVYIPFVRDTDKQVYSSLLVRVKRKDTTYKMLYANQFASYGFDTTDAKKWSARNVFHLFARFDNSIFGTTQFQVTSKKLFRLKRDSLQPVVTFKEINGRNQTGRTTNMMQTCVTLTICWNYVQQTTPPQVRTNSLIGCAFTTYQNYCTTFYSEDPGSGAVPIETPSGGGGGSSGTSWYYPP